MLYPQYPALPIAFLIVTLTGGCGPKAEEAPDELDPRVTALREDPARCGADAYAWLPGTAVGEPIGWEDGFFDELTVEDLEALADLVGIGVGAPLIHDVRLAKIRYSTQDRGQVVEATGLMAIPTSTPEHPGPTPLMLMLHGTSGFNDSCAPSAGLADNVGAALIASLGFAAVMPDYLGMNSWGEPSTQLHPYVVAEPTALASLDAVRAARRFLEGELGVESNVPATGYVIAGGSQGGHAALFAALYAPYYLPEEDLRGVVSSVPVADILGEMTYWATHWGLGTDNVAVILAAMSDWYGLPLTPVLREPVASEIQSKMEETCSMGVLTEPAGSLDELFTPDFLLAASRSFPDDGSGTSCMIRESSILHTSIEPLEFPPTLFILGEEDFLVQTDVERAAFDSLCLQGHQMEYLECEGADHIQTGATSLAEQGAFLADRFFGRPWDPERICRRGPPAPCSGTFTPP